MSDKTKRIAGICLILVSVIFLLAALSITVSAANSPSQEKGFWDSIIEFFKNLFLGKSITGQFSYWNGKDTTLGEVFATQWGLSNAYFNEMETPDAFITVTNGEIAIDGGWAEFDFDCAGEGNTYYLSHNYAWEPGINVWGATIEQTDMTDQDGYPVLKIITLESYFCGFQIENGGVIRLLNSTSGPAPVFCGNGILESGEQCDDGNFANGDGCSSTCQLEPMICGNGAREGTEQCDDGNIANEDCCSSTCQLTSGANGMVSYWKAENDAEDSSGSYDGTLKNGATFAAGKVGQAFSFDGVSDNVFMSISSTDYSSQAGTVSAWVKINGVYPGIILSSTSSSGESYLASIGFWTHTHSINEPQKIAILDPYSLSWIYGSTVISDGQWHHLVYISDGTKYSLYVDGNLETLTVEGGNGNYGTWFGDIPNRDNLVFGGNYLSGSYDIHGAFNGSIDEVAIFNRALTATEVNDLYQKGQSNVGYCEELPVPVCGNGAKEGTEQCDDGNIVSGDGCSSTCQTESIVCGNGAKEGTEQCDDGNIVSGDGCSSTCQLECADADADGISTNGGVCGATDNCPNVYNPDQINTDGDSLGDVCDSCPGDATNNCVVGKDAAQTMTSAGGTIATADGSASISLPSGALTNPTTTTIINKIGNFAVSINEGIGVTMIHYDILPSGKTFSQPLTLTFHYPQGNMPECGKTESKVAIWYKDPALGWTKLSNLMLNCTTNIVSVPVTHFSEYAAIVPLDSDGDDYASEWAGVIDCNDNNASVYPGADDAVCDGVDNDCDGSYDEDYSPTSTTCGVGECVAQGQLICQSGVEYNTCEPKLPANDANCNGKDENCNGVNDDGYVSSQTTCGEGFCSNTGTLQCINGAPYDSCQPLPPKSFYFDGDFDNYGTALDIQLACLAPSGYLLADEDCNDAEPTVNPGASDICNIERTVLDKNCNVSDDYLLDCNDFCGDVDGDGFVTDQKWNDWGGIIPTIICPWIVDRGDCNDFDPTAYPAADDSACNGVDNNCNGQADDEYVPGQTTCGVGACQRTGSLICSNGQNQDTCVPGAPTIETCNGLDDDCNGVSDDADADNDGINDCFNDLCLNSVVDNIGLNPNQYAQNNILTSAFESGPRNDQSIVYNMQNTKGCTCRQIVEKLGVGVGQIKKGCSPSVMQEWTGLSGEPDRAAGIGKK